MSPDKISDLIERIADESNGAITSSYLWTGIASGAFALLTPDEETVLILKEYETPTGIRGVEFVGLAGKMDAWPKIAPKLEAEARARGINRFRAEGRVGWAREAKKYGWKVTRVIIEKDLYDA